MFAQLQYFERLLSLRRGPTLLLAIVVGCSTPPLREPLQIPPTESELRLRGDISFVEFHGDTSLKVYQGVGEDAVSGEHRRSTEAFIGVIGRERTSIRTAAVPGRNEYVVEDDFRSQGRFSLVVPPATIVRLRFSIVSFSGGDDPRFVLDAEVIERRYARIDVYCPEPVHDATSTLDTERPICSTFLALLR
jgi:hypothetical protein